MNLVTISKSIKIVLLSGLVLSTCNSYSIASLNKAFNYAKFPVAFGLLFTNALIAYKQDENPIEHPGFVNWYKRVICGHVSKKVQKIKPEANDDEQSEYIARIKDTYTKPSGLFGHVISFYNKNEDVKKAAAFAALLTVGTFNKDIKNVLGNLVKTAPYADFFKVV